MTIDDFGMQTHLDIRFRCDLLHQVVRHTRGERATTCEDRDLFRVLRQINGGLACGVTCTRNEHVLSFHCLSLGNSAPIENPCSNQRFETRNADMLVVGPRRQKDRSAHDFCLVREHQDAVASLHSQTGRLSQNRGFCPERPGLVEEPDWSGLRR